jgi:hypothetical protein
MYTKPSTRTIAESTHVAAMIYYGKTLFGREPKLTTAQKHTSLNCVDRILNVQCFNLLK